MIEQLKTTIKGRAEMKGYTFIQVEATDKGFIYSKNRDGKVVSYEVFKKKVRKARPSFGKMNDYIAYPHSEAFGDWAWDVKTLQRAKERLADL